MNTPACTSSSPVIEATRVEAGEPKLEVLPRHFGKLMLRVEDAVYHFMRLLCTDYRGGYWHFYELSNGGFYMAPDVEPVHVRVHANNYEGQMSADAAGITACLFAFSHLSFESRHDVLVRHFYQLREFAQAHAEAREIFAAID